MMMTSRIMAEQRLAFIFSFFKQSYDISQSHLSRMRTETSRILMACYSFPH